MTQPWKSDLFGCFNDVPTCLLGWCCPCYLFGTNAEKIDGSSKITMCVGYALLTGCALCCILHKPRRERLRANYNLQEQPTDLLATCCCSGCAICQEARELNGRGVQPGGGGGGGMARPPPIISQPGRK